MTLTRAVVGLAVRHQKRVEWGIGVIGAVTAAAKGFDIAIAFEDGSERRVRVLDDTGFDAMFALVPNDELMRRAEAAVDAARAAERERRARRAEQPKSIACEPAAKLEVGYGGMVALRGGAVAAVCQHEGGAHTIGIFESAALVDQIEVAATWSADLLQVVPFDGDELIVGSRVHEYAELVFARRGQDQATVWKAPGPVGIARATPAPDVGAVAFDMHHIYIARPDGRSDVVPLPLGERHIQRVRFWGHDLLVGTGAKSNNDADYFRYACVAGDGSVRFDGVGATPEPFDDDTAIVFSHHSTRALDRDGNVIATLPFHVDWPDTLQDRASVFARVDNDIVIASGHREVLLRWNPRSNEPKWTVPLELPSPTAPVRVGAFIAVTSNLYSDERGRTIHVFDAETGRRAYAFESRSDVSQLVAVGDSALAAQTFAKNVPVWRNLGGAVEKLMLKHDDGKCLDVVAAGTHVITRDGKAMRFYSV